MTWLLDPKLFNYLIMSLYLINSLQFAARRMWADSSYWLCALGITATVTWGYLR